MTTVTINVDCDETVVTEGNYSYTIKKVYTPTLAPVVEQALLSGDLGRLIRDKRWGGMSSDERRYLAFAASGRAVFVSCKAIAAWSREHGKDVHANRINHRLRTLGLGVNKVKHVCGVWINWTLDY